MGNHSRRRIRSDWLGEKQSSTERTQMILSSEAKLPLQDQRWRWWGLQRRLKHLVSKGAHAGQSERKTVGRHSNPLPSWWIKAEVQINFLCLQKEHQCIRFNNTPSVVPIRPPWTAQPNEMQLWCRYPSLERFIVVRLMPDSWCPTAAKIKLVVAPKAEFKCKQPFSSLFYSKESFCCSLCSLQPCELICCSNNAVFFFILTPFIFRCISAVWP